MLERIEDGKQASLSHADRKARIRSRLEELYREQNLAAARVILERPKAHRGAILDWARRIVTRGQAQAAGGGA